MADKWIQLQSADGVDNLFPVGRLDIVWKNASPSSSFSAQTIQLDLSKYTFLIVEAKWSTSDNQGVTAVVHVGEKATLCCDWNNRIAREVATTTTSITFGNGQTGSQGNGVSANSGFAIPLYVYGVKGTTVDLT